MILLGQGWSCLIATPEYPVHLANFVQKTCKQGEIQINYSQSYKYA